MNQDARLAASIEETLRHAIAHAKNFGERSVLLPMNIAEHMQQEAAELAQALDAKPAPRKR